MQQDFIISYIRNLLTYILTFVQFGDLIHIRIHAILSRYHKAAPNISLKVTQLIEFVIRNLHTKYDNGFNNLSKY